MSLKELAMKVLFYDDTNSCWLIESFNFAYVTYKNIDVLWECEEVAVNVELYIDIA
jgi:hypothetical protein